MNVRDFIANWLYEYTKFATLIHYGLVKETGMIFPFK